LKAGKGGSDYDKVDDGLSNQQADDQLSDANRNAQPDLAHTSTVVGGCEWTRLLRSVQSDRIGTYPTFVGAWIALWTEVAPGSDDLSFRALVNSSDVFGSTQLYR
jgi:hypothetical protein